MSTPPHLELLLHPALTVPVAVRAGEVVEHIRMLGEGFFAAVMAADPADPVVAECQKLVGESRAFLAQLCEAAVQYLRGQPARAFGTIETAMGSTPAIDRLLLEVIPSDRFSALFRSRRFPDVPHNASRDMFHIPVQLRHLVETQRFSIPGFPCLYFGSTSLVCWNELGRPPLTEFVTARFELAAPGPVRVLNLCNPPSWLHFRLTSYPRSLDPVSALPDYMFVWPLLAACSLPVRERKGYFKPEYVVPQLMMQWLASRPDVAALGYTSNRLGPLTCATIAQNWVFPPRGDDTDANGHFMDLLGAFRATDPLPWALRDAVRSRPRLTPRVGNHGHEVAALSGTKPTQYALTAFFDYDSLLMGMDATPL